MTERTRDRQEPSWSYGLPRRLVLRAVGAGSALGLVSGGTAAHADEEHADDDGSRTSTDDACEQQDCVHPVLGFSVLEEDATPPSSLDPDHTVAATQRPKEHEVIPEEIPLEFFFDPVGLHVEPGDVVEFRIEQGEHTVTAYHEARTRQRRVPEGVPPFSSPMLGPGMAWLYRFEECGVYDILCAPHEHFGMVMRVVVGGVTEPNFGEVGTQDPPRPPFPPFDFARAVLDSEAEDTPDLDEDDVDELGPERIVDQGSVSWDELFQ